MNHTEGWGFELDQVRAMIAELERELEQRRRHYPERVRKGDLLPEQAEQKIGIIAELRADLDVAFHPAPWTVPTGMNLVAPAFPWAAKVRELERLLAQRERHYPDKVRKGELLEADGKAQLEAIELVHQLYHWKLFGWLSENPEAKAYRQAVIGRLSRDGRGADFADLNQHPGRAIERDEVRAILLEQQAILAGEQ